LVSDIETTKRPVVHFQKEVDRMQGMRVHPQATRRQGGGLEYKWIVAWVVVIGVFMSVLDSTIVNIAIPRLQSAFGADLHSVQFVSTAYLLTLGVVTPTTAFFADRFGIKRFYITALLAFTAGSALCGLAWSLPVLVFFRILQGLGGAALFPLSLSLLFQEFPAGERGLAMGVFGLPALLGPALGPTLGGYIVTFGDWQLIFYINVPVGIIAIILAMVFLRERLAERRPSFDVAGFLFSATGLACVLYAFSEVSTYGWGSTPVLALLGIGVVALALFVATELSIAWRGGAPLLDLRVFADRLFAISTIANVLAIFTLFGGLFLLPVYLQSLRGLSAFQAGLVLLPQAFASAVSVLVGGRLVDRIGVRAVVIPGLLVLGLASWQLSFLTLSSPYGWIQVMLILRGLSLGLVVQPLVVSMMAEIRPQQLTQASSINTVVRSVASSFGIAILATFVQTQTKVHYTHLAERVTAGSPLGQLLPRLQALFIAHGASIDTARRAAVEVLVQLVQRQGYDLAMQDAFRLTVGLVVLAVIVTLFVRGRRRKAGILEQPTSPGVPAAGERAEGESALAPI
jgi:EmrB/QacA subfamily drug resistance transporter